MAQFEDIPKSTILTEKAIPIPFNLYRELVSVYNQVKETNTISNYERWQLQLEILREISCLKE